METLIISDLDGTLLPEGQKTLDPALFRRLLRLKEQGIDFLLKPCSCDGIEECKVALLQKTRAKLDANFIEGMACIGGCIGGNECL